MTRYYYQNHRYLFTSIYLIYFVFSACQQTDTTSENTHIPLPPIMHDNLPCTAHWDCPSQQMCLYNICVDEYVPNRTQSTKPRMQLTAWPQHLDFGEIAPTLTQSLAIHVKNTGQTVLTIADIFIESQNSVFQISPLGYGPFWIRPSRSRQIFVTYTPGSHGQNSGVLTITSPAPSIHVQLSGN